MQHKFFFRALALASFVAGTQAHAEISGILTQSNASVDLYTKNFLGLGISLGLNSSFDGTDIGFESGYKVMGTASTFSATSQLDPDFISFRNGNVSSGLLSVTTSHTIMEITYTNDTGHDVSPKLISTIVPAGLGIFVDQSSCLDHLTGCLPGELLGDPSTFSSFLPSGKGGYGNLLAGASFDFKVSGGGQTLYDLAGGVTLQQQGGNNVLVTDLGDAAAALNGYEVTSPLGSDQQFGVHWDATPFQVDFGLGNMLAPGQSTTLVYETTVTTFVQSECVTSPSDACLISYSAFGDPIGRGGGVIPTLSSFLSPLSVSLPDLFRSFTPSEDDLLGIGTFKFKKPTDKDGVISFELSVPEPASWALMIGGFAAVGGILRRRRTLAYSLQG